MGKSADDLGKIFCGSFKKLRMGEFLGLILHFLRYSYDDFSFSLAKSYDEYMMSKIDTIDLARKFNL